jgi:hypothetical protein
MRVDWLEGALKFGNNKSRGLKACVKKKVESRSGDFNFLGGDRSDNDKDLHVKPDRDLDLYTE